VTSDEHYPYDDIGLESIHCFGLCGTSPGMGIDGKPCAKLIPVRLTRRSAGLCSRWHLAWQVYDAVFINLERK
jgi:hypothetical protein